MAGTLAIGSTVVLNLDQAIVEKPPNEAHYIQIGAPKRTSGQPGKTPEKGYNSQLTAMSASKGASPSSDPSEPRQRSGKPPLKGSSPRRFEFSQIHMGTRVRIVLYAHSHSSAEKIARLAFARFAELDLRLSDYNPDSELMRLCSAPFNSPVPVSRDVFLVLQRAQELACLTEGAFDVTIGALTHLWRKARKEGRVPREEEILGAYSRVSWHFVALDETESRVTLLKPGILLDVGGIAKGYACDEALRLISAQGILRALVEAGGDIAVSGPPPGQPGWHVRIPNGTTLSVAHCGVSTSGDWEQFIQFGTERYSHILDPRTGKALTNQNTVTVIAQDAFTSDSLATALSLLPPESKAQDRLRERFHHKVYVFPHIPPKGYREFNPPVSPPPT